MDSVNENSPIKPKLNAKQSMKQSIKSNFNTNVKSSIKAHANLNANLNAKLNDNLNAKLNGNSTNDKPTNVNRSEDLVSDLNNNGSSNSNNNVLIGNGYLNTNLNSNTNLSPNPSPGSNLNQNQNQNLHLNLNPNPSANPNAILKTTDTLAKSNTKLNAKSSTKSNTKYNTKSNAKSNVKSSKKSNSKSNTKLNSKSNTKANIKSNEIFNSNTIENDDPNGNSNAIQNSNSHATINISTDEILFGGISLVKFQKDYNATKSNNKRQKLTLLSEAEIKLIKSTIKTSRQSWLSGNLLDVYWKRPSRSKKSLLNSNVDTSPSLKEQKNTSRDKIYKLCECTMQIGIHHYDIKLFSTKTKIRYQEKDKNRDEHLGKKKNGFNIQNQNEPNSAIVNDKPGTHFITYQNQDQNQNQLNHTNNDSKVGVTPHTNFISYKPKVDQNQTNFETPTTSPAVNTPKVSDTNDTISLQSPNTSMNNTNPSFNQPQPPTPSTEQNFSPENLAVIGKLQLFAQLNPSLHTLMKIVATGNASQEQLSTFQLYIAEARKLVLAESSNANKEVPTPSYVPPPKKNKKKHSSIPSGNPNTELNNNTVTKTTVSNIDKKEKYTIKIVFEFHEHSSDRYLLPRLSIAEKTSSGLIVSFIMLFKNDSYNYEDINEQKDIDIRNTNYNDKNNDSNFLNLLHHSYKTLDSISHSNLYNSSGKYLNKEYFYLPITVQINSAPNNKIYDTIMNSFAPINESQCFMTKVIENCTRLPICLISKSLPA